MTEPAGWTIQDGFNFTRDVVERHAADRHARALSVVGGDGVIERTTFAELAADASRWAYLLRGRGHEPGDRVALTVVAPRTWLAIALGALKAGLVLVPLPTGLIPDDLGDRLERTGAAMLVSDPEGLEALGELDPELDVLALDEAAVLLRRCGSEAPTEPRLADDPALVLFTPGASSEPRAVVHTHAYTHAMQQQAAHWLGASPGDLVWSSAVPGETRWIWNSLFGPWSCGAEVVVHTGVTEPGERLELVDVLGVDILCQMPIEHRRLSELDPLLAPTPRRLRSLLSTGAPLGADVKAVLRETRGLAVHEGYGMTEAAVLIASTSERPAPDDALGWPTPGHEVAVIDASGNTVPDGVEGEIALLGRPAALFAGYLGEPTASAAAARGDWYATGDRGVRAPDGSFRFCGRLGDEIDTGEAHVRPFELEEQLLRHPAVLDVVVVGRPDREGRETPKAFIVPRGDVDDGEGLAAELAEQASCSDAAHGSGVEAELVDELPYASGGKPARHALRLRELEQAGLRPAPRSRGHLSVVEGGAVQDDHIASRAAVPVTPRLAGARVVDERAEEARHRAAERDEKRRLEAERRAADETRKAAIHAMKAEQERAKAEAEERKRAERAQQKAEKQRLRAEEDERKRAAEAERKAEKERLRAEAEERKRTEQAERTAAREAQRAAETQRREEEAARKIAERERQHAEKEARAAARRLERAEEAERKRLAQAERRAESMRLRAEAEERTRAEAAEAEERKRDEAARRSVEKDQRADERRLREAEEAERKRAADEAERVAAAERRTAEESEKADAAARKEDEARRKAEAREQARQAEADRKAAEAEEKQRARQAEADRKAAEAEEKQRARQAEAERKAAEAEEKEPARQAEAERAAEARERDEAQREQQLEDERRREAEEAARAAALLARADERQQAARAAAAAPPAEPLDTTLLRAAAEAETAARQADDAEPAPQAPPAREPAPVDEESEPRRRKGRPRPQPASAREDEDDEALGEMLVDRLSAYGVQPTDPDGTGS